MIEWTLKNHYISKQSRGHENKNKICVKLLQFFCLCIYIIWSRIVFRIFWKLANSKFYTTAISTAYYPWFLSAASLLRCVPLLVTEQQWVCSQSLRGARSRLLVAMSMRRLRVQYSQIGRQRWLKFFISRQGCAHWFVLSKLEADRLLRLQVDRSWGK